jgi:hypothetical protein
MLQVCIYKSVKLLFATHFTLAFLLSLSMTRGERQAASGRPSPGSTQIFILKGSNLGQFTSLLLFQLLNKIIKATCHRFCFLDWNWLDVLILFELIGWNNCILEGIYCILYIFNNKKAPGVYIWCHEAGCEICWEILLNVRCWND